MAGDIESSPYTLNFQADSLHSGSISFGRFENEALCWERRSSFSHNRYLEDAEKYSRPGSVNEKKAYFEAHFRRRALMKQASSGSQNGTDYLSSDNDFSETMSYEYDNFGSFRERSNSARFEYLVSGREFEESCSATERGTPYDPQNGIQCARPDSECGTSICDLVNMEELQHDEVGNVNLMNKEPEIKNLNTEAGKLDMSCKASSVSSYGHSIERDNSVNSDHQTPEMILDIGNLSARHPHCETVTTIGSEYPDDASDKEMVATSQPREKKSQPKEMKSDRTIISTQRMRASSGVESRKSASNVPSKNVVGKHTKKEANDLLRLKREKVAAESASPTTKLYNHNRLKQEVPHNSKSKPLHLNRSLDLDSRTRRKENPLRPSSGNVTPKLSSTVNRPRQAFGSLRPGIKQNDSAFSFKNDERAEKRKEILVKLEEKIHTKEAEIHQLQAKRQGTPSNINSSTPLGRRSVAARETCERSPSFSEAGSERAPSSGEPRNKTLLQHHQDVSVTSFLRAARPKSSHSAALGWKTQAILANPLITKKTQENEKHQRSPSCSMERSERTSSAGEPLNKTLVQRDKEVTSFTQAARPRSSHSAAPGWRTQASTANPLIMKRRDANQKHQRFPSCSMERCERTPSAGVPLNKALVQWDKELTSFTRAARPRSSHSAAPGCRTEASTANPLITKKRHANEKHQRSPSCSMKRSERTPSASKPLNKTPVQRDKELTSSTPAARPRSSHSAAPGCRTKATTANALTTKKKQGNEKSQSTQHIDLVSIGKVTNETKRVADQLKLNSDNSSTRVVRKDMRGAGFGGSARFSHLTVGVAS